MQNYFLWIIIGVPALILLWAVFAYNRFVRLVNQAKEAWSDIEVQMKRRYDLIPNVVETVKGYAAHERNVLENVTKARTQAMGAQSIEDHAKAENVLAGTLKTLFAVAEGYPDLKANANFLDLQRELADTENKMMASRRFYNGTVMNLNTAIQTFPTNIIAQSFGFKEEKFFAAGSEDEKEPVKVQF